LNPSKVEMINSCQHQCGTLRHSSSLLTRKHIESFTSGLIMLVILNYVLLQLD